MQLKSKPHQPPIQNQQDISVAAYQQIQGRLHQILECLTQEKQTWYQQQIRKTQQLCQTISERQQLIHQLATQNNQLKHQLQVMTGQFQQTQAIVASLRREKQLLQSQSTRSNNIIAYLQAKNKQLNYQLFQARRILGQKINKEMLLRTSNCNFPECGFNKVESPSIFEHTGVLDLQISAQQLHKIESSPSLEIITATSSCHPKISRIQKARQSREVSRKDQLTSRRENHQPKNSLKKTNTLAQIFDTDLKKKMKELKSGKKLSVGQVFQNEEKLRIDVKSRVTVKKSSIGKKVK